MASEIGPGRTGFIANKDGSIDVRRWNARAWTTRFADAHTLTGVDAAENITRLLARAYQMGMNDKRDLIKQALEV